MCVCVCVCERETESIVRVQANEAKKGFLIFLMLNKANLKEVLRIDRVFIGAVDLFCHGPV